jgi:hypothetical protein
MEAHALRRQVVDVVLVDPEVLGKVAGRCQACLTATPATRLSVLGVECRIPVLTLDLVEGSPSQVIPRASRPVTVGDRQVGEVAFLEPGSFPKAGFGYVVSPDVSHGTGTTIVCLIAPGLSPRSLPGASDTTLKAAECCPRESALRRLSLRSLGIQWGAMLVP